MAYMIFSHIYEEKSDAKVLTELILAKEIVGSSYLRTCRELSVSPL